MVCSCVPRCGELVIRTEVGPEQHSFRSHLRPIPSPSFHHHHHFIYPAYTFNSLFTTLHITMFSENNSSQPPSYDVAVGGKPLCLRLASPGTFMLMMGHFTPQAHPTQRSTRVVINSLLPPLETQ